MSINATQSHSGEHLVAKRLYAILKYICLEKKVHVSSLSGVWGGVSAANNFAAFWTEMEASGAMISSNVCSFMDDAFIRLDFQPVVMDFILGM